MGAGRKRELDTTYYVRPYLAALAVEMEADAMGTSGVLAFVADSRFALARVQLLAGLQ
jgi:hypothetical protein